MNRGSGANVGTWYLDGTATGTFDTSARSGFLDNSAPLEIGAIELPLAGGTGNDRRWFKGGLDEVEIFNRALNPSEVLALYQAGSAGKCK